MTEAQSSVPAESADQSGAEPGALPANGLRANSLSLRSPTWMPISATKKPRRKYVQRPSSPSISCKACGSSAQRGASRG